MNILRRGHLVLVILLVVGCTPLQVRQLSIKQNEYFNLAINAVAEQSEVLMLVSEALINEVKEKISQEKKATQKVLLEKIKTNTLSAQVVERTVDTIISTAVDAEWSVNRLDRKLENIKAHIKDLELLLKKMKQAHMTLDSYIQSEKAGEIFLKNIIKQPTVSAFLDDINELTPDINKSTSELNSLLIMLN